jgi:thiamine-monophosphate kinase
MPSEFDIIHRYFAGSNLAPPTTDKQCLLGIGDDCALLQSDAACSLAFSVDTLVDGVHFPNDSPAFLVGYRALMVNVSDLAAMGATPAYFTLALTIPWSDEQWIHDFAEGLSAVAKMHSIYLIGGDTTRGPLSITIQVIGQVLPNNALKRSGAKVGDGIYVTGTLGDAMAGLQILQEEIMGDDSAMDYLINRFYQPSARVEVGKALGGVANSAIDISDGLLADLSHILKASEVGARVLIDSVPLSESLLSIMDKKAAQQLALTGGDDYELCFTASKDKENKLAEISESTGVTIRRIGEITGDKELTCVDSNNETVEFTTLGFRHF